LPLHDPGLEHRLPDRTLQHRLVKVMAAVLTDRSIDVEPRRGKDPPASPFAARVRILACARPGKFDPAGPVRQVSSVTRSHALDMSREIALGGDRQHGHAILAALSVADRDLIRREADVLDTQTAAFHQTEPGAIEEKGHQARNVVKRIDHSLGLVARQDDRQMLRALRADGRDRRATGTRPRALLGTGTGGRSAPGSASRRLRDRESQAR
jgi:hypothetical protein